MPDLEEDTPENAPLLSVIVSLTVSITFSITATSDRIPLQNLAYVRDVVSHHQYTSQIQSIRWP